MSNIRVLVTESAKTNEDCIRILKDLLEDAESGEITGIAAVYTLSDRSVVTVSSDTDNLPGLLGGIDILKHRILADF